MTSLIRAVVFAVSFFLLLPRSFYNPITSGLDGSWAIALHLAFERGMSFGEDVVFTFGPLGVLATRLPIGEGIRALLAAFDLFFYLNLLNVLWFLLRAENLYWRALALIIFAFAHSQAVHFLDPPISSVLFCYFWLCRSQKDDSDLFFVFALANALITFYLKVHLGVLSLGLIFIATVLHGAAQQTYRHVLRLAATVAVVAVSGHALGVSFAGYLNSARHFAASYADAMWLEQRGYRELMECCAAMMIFATSIFVLAAIASYRRTDEVLRIGAGLIILAVIWKQAVVRADGHLWMFIELAPIVLAFTTMFSSESNRRVMYGACLVAVALQFYASPARSFAAAFEAKFADIARTRSQLFNQTMNPRPDAIPEASLLPTDFVRTVGARSVDIIPHELASLYYYSLNFRPRGVLQSYAAYDSFLDELGAARLSSKEAPQFIVFRYECIDSRYCLFDEPRTKRSMIEYYDLRQRSGDLLLFERRGIPSSMEEEIVSSGTASLGEAIDIPESDEVVLFRTSVDYSPMGRLRRFAYRPSGLQVVLKPETGEHQLKKRAVLPLLEDGVPINYRVLDTDDAANFFSGKFQALEKFRTVEIDSDERSDFQPRYFYEFVRLRFSAAPSTDRQK